MSKQDRQGVRTPVDLERKYSFGQTFSRQDTQIHQLDQEVAQYAKKTTRLEERVADLEEAEGSLIVAIKISEA